MSGTRYHEGGYTLDPSNPIEDDAPRAASTDEEQAEAIKEAADEHVKASEAEAKAAAKAQPQTDLKPSEALRATGREPEPEKKSESKKGK